MIACSPASLLSCCLPCSGGLATGSRRRVAVRVRLGEKEALDATLRYFEDRISRWVGSHLVC
jgi:hypothetical protein